jgi:hypothetical protein
MCFKAEEEAGAVRKEPKALNDGSSSLYYVKYGDSKCTDWLAQ